jgi:hypothetical protein
MGMVNSKQKLLTGPEIITQAIYNREGYGDRATSVLAQVSMELSKPNIDIVQIGNTAFAGYKRKSDKNTEMYGLIFNADTGRNFLVNGFKYFTYLQKRGIKKYVTYFTDPTYVKMFNIYQKKMQDEDVNIALGRPKGSEGKYVAVVEIGEEPLLTGV